MTKVENPTAQRPSPREKTKHKSRNRILGLTGAIAAFIVATPAKQAAAGNCTGTWNTTAIADGSLADASPVMTNFTTLYNCANTFPSGLIVANASTVGGSAGNTLTVANLSGSAGNNMFLNLLLYRQTAGSGWPGVATRLQAGVDATNMGYIDFNPGYGTEGIAFGNAGSEYMRITSSGYVGIGTTSPGYLLTVNGTAYASGAAGALSDIRHKDEVESLPSGALKLVEKLRPVSFVWKEPKDDGMKGRQMGFIAQEVEKILPSVVLTEHNAEKTKGLKYNEIIALLTKAMQEQQEEIEQLKAANESYKATNAAYATEFKAIQQQLSDIQRNSRVRTAAN